MPPRPTVYVLALALALVLPGCGSADDVCVRAAAHMAACLGTESPPPGDAEACDPGAARALLASDCPALTAQKADGGLLAVAACQMGFLRFCPTPACETQAPRPESRCEDLVDVSGCGGCGLYACLDARTGCGRDGYYRSYAEKYCLRLLLTTGPRLSPAGQRFLDAGRDCLMRSALREPADAACDAIARRALDAHVRCYVESGYCALSARDRSLLLLSIDPVDLDLVTALRAGLACLAP